MTTYKMAAADFLLREADLNISACSLFWFQITIWCLRKMRKISAQTATNATATTTMMATLIEETTLMLTPNGQVHTTRPHDNKVTMTTANKRGIVMRTPYRKCKRRAIKRSKLIASKINMERIPVYMSKPSLTSNKRHQNSPSKSCALKATKIGWTTQPTVKSVKANEHRSTFEGVWRDGVLTMAAITGMFCTVAVKQNTPFNTNIATLVGNIWSLLRGLSMMNEQWTVSFSIF